MTVLHAGGHSDIPGAKNGALSACLNALHAIVAADAFLACFTAALRHASKVQAASLAMLTSSSLELSQHPNRLLNKFCWHTPTNVSLALGGTLKIEAEKY